MVSQPPLRAHETEQHWIFLRGLGRDSRHWGDFVEEFKRQFPSAKVHLLDLPGSGQYASEPSPTSISIMTDFLVTHWQDQWKQTCASQPVNILALSLGAMVAVDWMNRYPYMIRSAALMNTSFRRVSPFYHRLRYQVFPDLLLLLISGTDRREAKILELISQMYPHRKALTQIWIDFSHKRPVNKLNFLKQLVAASRAELPEKKPEQPILLLNALTDRLVSSQCTTDIANIWNIPYRSHPISGHDMTLDVPFWILDQLKMWQKML